MSDKMKQTKSGHERGPHPINKSMRIIFPWLGWVGFAVCITCLMVISCSQSTPMNEQSQSFHTAIKKLSNNAVLLEPVKKDEVLKQFAKFLQSIDSEEYIEKNIDKVYAEGAYLNDTLKTLTNREQIKQHFVKTSKAMTAYSVSIDDISSSDKGYYIRWTMKYNAPKLAKGEEIESIGITYAEFDKDGKVLLHQDFWDSTSGFFDHVPLVGGGIRMIKKRL